MLSKRNSQKVRIPELENNRQEVTKLSSDQSLASVFVKIFLDILLYLKKITSIAWISGNLVPTKRTVEFIGLLFNKF